MIDAPIPLVDLVAQYRRYRDEIDAALQAVIENAAFIGGSFVAEFEAAFAAYTGVAHTAGVANGTDALLLIFRALGIGRGDEVIVPVNTFIATAEAVSLAGATPIFVDVRQDDALLDLAAARAAITPRTKAIVPVHLYGRLADMDGVSALASRAGLYVVEDAAQAHGASIRGRRAGSFGAGAGFSFYPGKNLGAYGDAGAVATNDASLAASIRKLANHGRSEKFGHDVEGTNSRLDGLQAAVLAVKLRHLDTATSERLAAAARYDQLLADVPDVQAPLRSPRGAHVYHLYAIHAPRRDALKAALAARGIQAGIHYPRPLHLEPAYARFGHPRGAFPVAEGLADTVLSLPLFPEITLAQQERVVSAIRELYRGRG